MNWSGDVDILALADDATGALEVGAQFADERVESRVSWAIYPSAVSEQALVIDTQTRHLRPAAARRTVYETASAAREAGFQHVYKKTDSTLRGNIAAEFAALLEAWPERALVYAPAYPALGRTVVNGQLRVDGKPLGETAFAADRLNPSRESYIPALFEDCGATVMGARDATELRKALSAGAAGRIVVCDGSFDSDLAALAGVVAGAGQPTIAAGPAALARPWIAALDPPRRQPSRTIRVRRCLVVSGSLHPASREQIARSGLAVLAHDSAAAETGLAVRLQKALEANRWVVLAASEQVRPDCLEVASHIARVVRHTLDAAQPDALVVFGGDTTLAVLGELGVSEAEPCGELVTGVPLSIIRHAGRQMALVTKAGGFGGPTTLLRIREILETP